MKKTIFIIAAILCMGLATSAQNKPSEKTKSTGYITLNGGISIPMEEYASANYGGVKQGENFHLDFSVPLFHSHFGICTKVDASTYNGSADPFLSAQQKLFDESGIGMYATLNPTGSGPSQQGNLLSGLFTSIPFNKTFSLDTRIPSPTRQR